MFQSHSITHLIEEFPFGLVGGGLGDRTISMTPLLSHRSQASKRIRPQFRRSGRRYISHGRHWQKSVYIAYTLHRRSYE
jgi:hypothetical protein